jgi:hypothetical protein
MQILAQVNFCFSVDFNFKQPHTKYEWIVGNINDMELIPFLRKTSVLPTNVLMQVIQLN